MYWWVSIESVGVGRTRCIPVEKRGKRFDSEGSAICSLEVFDVPVKDYFGYFLWISNSVLLLTLLWRKVVIWDFNLCDESSRGWAYDVFYLFVASFEFFSLFNAFDNFWIVATSN